MTPKSKKAIFIIIPIIILIIGIILAVLYYTTDFLKSNETLFLKYVSQNIEAAKAVIDNKSEKEYTNFLRQNKYESKSEVKASYTENISTSKENKNNDINKLKIISNNQSDYLNNYEYRDINIEYNESNLLQAEYIHDGEIYGVRFPNRFNQFLVIENQDLKQVAGKADLTENQIELVPNNIEEFNYNEVFSFTDEELQTIKNEYLNILATNISSDKYSKQKNAMITVGENSVMTTAYSITLNQEQANNVYIKILEQLKNDETIINKISQIEPIGILFNLIKQNEDDALNNKYLEEKYKQAIENKIENIQNNNIGTSEVKFTVYQHNGVTVRTQLVEESRQLTLDYSLMDNNIEVRIQNKNANQDQENESNIKLIKNNNNEEKNFSINIENTVGDLASTIEMYRNIKINDEETVADTGIKYNDGKDNYLEASLTEETNLIQEFQKEVKLDEANSVIINNYEKDNVTTWINQVKEYINNKQTENRTIIENIEKIPIISKIFGKFQETIDTKVNETTEVERNRFNAKFEFYTGKEKKTEDVLKFLDEAKNNLSGAQVSYSNEGNTAGTKKLESIKIQVADDANKPELAESIKEMIEKNKTYTVEIEKDSSDIVNAINITVNKK